jgi:hypothetical protein
MNYRQDRIIGSGTLNSGSKWQVRTSAVKERNPDDDARCKSHINAKLLSVYSTERGFFPIFIDVLYELLIN